MNILPVPRTSPPGAGFSNPLSLRDWNAPDESKPEGEGAFQILEAYMFFDPMYFVFALPALLLGLWAQARVKSALNKYSRQRTANGMTGKEFARRLLDYHNLQNIDIEPTQGFLGDYYDPVAKVLRLSPEVYDVPSVAAAGVAAHESGHALQQAAGYAPLAVRSFIVPGVQIGSWLGPILFMVGLFTSRFFGTGLAWAGVALFGLTAVFSLVTLPVEFDASRRAKQLLGEYGLVYGSELEGVSKVLDAAALTYVAAAFQAVSTVLYYIFLLTGFRRRN